ncbi:MAG: dephospho-CoA kinase [Alphaproteobacteria bacterium]
MIIVGITGSIGCGKTYLANIIRSLGFATYNPDHWVRDLYRKAEFLKVIQKEFPSTFDEQGIFNKRMLRNIVFNDNKQLKHLESLIHPFLKRKLKQIIHTKALKDEILFLDVALLFEMHWDKYCDFIIDADVTDNIQMQRVIERDHITEEDFKKIISVQSSKDFKKYKSDYVIDTALPYGINKMQLIKFIQEVL